MAEGGENHKDGSEWNYHGKEYKGQREIVCYGCGEKLSFFSEIKTIWD